jgi:sugar phosphate isomerase/epimerase
MTLSRRNLIGTGAMALAAAPTTALAQSATPARKIHLAVSSYSYWHFKPVKFPIEDVIDHAAELGFDGVEILHRQMRDESASYVNGLKKRAMERGLSFPMLSIHQDFVSPAADERQRQIDHTIRCLELSARLGIPCMRLNSGRWKTIKSFDDLMKVKGDEPPLEGYKLEDAINWCVSSIEACLPIAEKLGVTMALENHWGLTTSIETLLKIHKIVNSPWLGINLDTGNYPGDAYQGIAQLAPHATFVQAKTYYGGGEWYTLDLDYKRIAGLLRQAGYGGWVSLEMEGKQEPRSAVSKSFQVLKEAFA